MLFHSRAVFVIGSLFASACGARSDLTLGNAVASDAGAPTIDSGAVDSGTTGSAHPDSTVAIDAGSVFAGTYLNCASGVQVSQDVSGFQSWTYVRVSQSGNTVTASFVDDDASAWSVRFASTTETSAVLEPGQTLSGPYIYTSCVFGLGDVGQEPATVALANGELTYDHSTLFLSMTGTASTTDAGMCDTANIPATVWLACQVGDGGTGSSREVDAAAPVPTPSFPGGAYTCSSIIDQTLQTDGGSDNSVGGSGPALGDAGVLTLAQTGAVLTAEYSGDTSLSGSLRFTVDTSTAATTASAGAGQTLATPCQVPINLEGPPLPSTPEPLTVEAASLTFDGATLFLTFAGTMTGPICPGAEAAGSLVCSKL